MRNTIKELAMRIKHFTTTRACTDGCCIWCTYFNDCYKDFGAKEEVEP